MSNRKEKYSEIILLGGILQEKKIDYHQHELYDGYQILVPLDGEACEISVIEHQGSYGSAFNMLEIADGKSIRGFLSAKQVAKVIEKMKGRESPK